MSEKEPLEFKELCILYDSEIDDKMSYQVQQFNFSRCMILDDGKIQLHMKVILNFISKMHCEYVIRGV